MKDCHRRYIPGTIWKILHVYIGGLLRPHLINPKSPFGRSLGVKAWETHALRNISNRVYKSLWSRCPSIIFLHATVVLVQLRRVSYEGYGRRVALISMSRLLTASVRKLARHCYNAALQRRTNTNPAMLPVLIRRKAFRQKVTQTRLFQAQGIPKYIRSNRKPR